MLNESVIQELSEEYSMPVHTVKTWSEYSFIRGKESALRCCLFWLGIIKSDNVTPSVEVTPKVISKVFKGNHPTNKREFPVTVRGTVYLSFNQISKEFDVEESIVRLVFNHFYNKTYKSIISKFIDWDGEVSATKLPKVYKHHLILSRQDVYDLFGVSRESLDVILEYVNQVWSQAFPLLEDLRGLPEDFVRSEISKLRAKKRFNLVFPVKVYSRSVGSMEELSQYLGVSLHVIEYCFQLPYIDSSKKFLVILTRLSKYPKQQQENVLKDSLLLGIDIPTYSGLCAEFPREINNECLSYIRFLHRYKLTDSYVKMKYKSMCYYSGLYVDKFIEFLMLTEEEKKDVLNKRRLLSSKEFFAYPKINNKSCFMLCNSLFIANTAELKKKFGVSEYRVKSNQEKYGDSELGFIATFIDDIILKKCQGSVGSSLTVEEQSFILEDKKEIYYRCVFSSKVEYLESKEIMGMYLSSAHIGDNSGKYGLSFVDAKAACSFYNIKPVYADICYNNFMSDKDILHSLTHSTSRPVKITPNGVVYDKDLEDLSPKDRTRVLTKKLPEEEFNAILSMRNFSLKVPEYKDGKKVGEVTMKFKNKDELQDKLGVVFKSLTLEGLQKEVFSEMERVYECNVNLFGYSFKDYRQVSALLNLGAELEKISKSRSVINIDIVNCVFSNHSLSYSNKQRLKSMGIEIIRWSFFSESDQLDYMLCKDRGKSRVRNFSSLELTKILVQSAFNQRIEFINCGDV